MIVDTHNARAVLQEFIDEGGYLRGGHAGPQLPRFRRLIGDGLHRQMKHDLVATATKSCFICDINGMLVIRQDGNGERITQIKNGFGRSTVAAEVIQSDRELRSRSFSARIS